MHRNTISALLVACAFLPATVAAQAPREPAVPSQPAPPKLDPRACTDRDRLKGGDTVETEGRGGQSQQPLSDKLARTDGVICPPAGLDPHIRAPAPSTGSDMPVIPPSTLPDLQETPPK